MSNLVPSEICRFDSGQECAIHELLSQKQQTKIERRVCCPSERQRDQPVEQSNLPIKISVYYVDFYGKREITLNIKNKVVNYATAIHKAT